MWKRDGTVAVTNGNKKVTGTGTTFADTKNGVARATFASPVCKIPVDFYEGTTWCPTRSCIWCRPTVALLPRAKAYHHDFLRIPSLVCPPTDRHTEAYQQQSDAFQALLTSTATTVGDCTGWNQAKH